MNYFWDPPGKPIGVKANINRHREKAKELDARISEAEQRGDTSMARTWRHFRCVLDQSMANVVSKLGRTKLK